MPIPRSVSSRSVLARSVWVGGTAIVLLATLATRAPTVDAQATPAAPGHCAFSLKNQWVGPLKACVDPSTPAQCAELGKKDENSAATYGEGACPAASMVGTCKTAASALHYYEGDASGLEVGCGFQSGEWQAAAR